MYFNEQRARPERYDRFSSPPSPPILNFRASKIKIIKQSSHPTKTQDVLGTAMGGDGGRRQSARRSCGRLDSKLAVLLNSFFACHNVRGTLVLD